MAWAREGVEGAARTGGVWGAGYGGGGAGVGCGVG